MINIALCGGYGKMGRTIAGLCESGKEYHISYIIETNDKCLLTNLGIGIKLSDVIDHDDIDVVVDFTSKDSCLEHMKISIDNGKPFVTGTTGFNENDLIGINKLAENGKVFYSPNFSPGIYILGKALNKISELAQDDYDIEMLEMHHNQKTDAPSGTALKLRDILLSSYPDHNVIYGRKGDYKPRSRNEIAIHTLRGGDVVGDHKVIFAGNGERIELTHKAISRDTFAFGVLKAVEYITKQKEKRLYGMDDLF
ncbi:MAG: 4-hydroxy-tetrahydrodipicolinate reductase [Candidatus Delongbacteria bacterium]|nr:4-hydroxy-tetrahydrodipicolinate reductase [Candidatus Delongbacteria bacterium]